MLTWITVRADFDNFIGADFHRAMDVATAPGETPHRAPSCEELDPPYDIKLVFVQKITFVLWWQQQKLLPPELHFLTPTHTHAPVYALFRDYPGDSQYAPNRLSTGAPPPK